MTDAEAIEALGCLLVIVAAYAHIALVALSMRDELRRRDAEGCKHGTGPDGLPREKP